MTQKLWADLHHTVTHCQKCQLWDQRTRPPLGVGNPEADLLFVVDSSDEVSPDDVLSAPIGKCMDDFLSIINVNRRTDLYLTSMLKCYPLKQRTPLATEYRNCLDYLRAQVRLMKPTIIVCFGQSVASALISPDFDLVLEHGTFIEKAGVHMTGFFTFQEVTCNPDVKPLMLKDMTQLEAKLVELTLHTTEDAL